MAPQNRTDFRKMVAQSFIDALQENGLEWKSTWASVSARPRNGVTGKRYTGINAFYLGLVSMIKGYSDPRWVTMTQIMDANGYYHPKQKWHLQKGSQAVYVEYWYPYDVVNHKMMKWGDYFKLPSAERDDPALYLLRCRYTPVFHASMVDGMPQLVQQAREPKELSDVVKTLSANMGVEILHDGGNQSFYRPAEDKIHLPEASQFYSEYDLDATALHELAHATGHESRLNRPIRNLFGSDKYAYEELVAEISSCFMSFDLDVPMTQEHMDNHKAYVQGWIDGIRDKPEILTKAIDDAKTAAAYMDKAAGLITEAEYSEAKNVSLTVPEKQTQDALDGATLEVYQLSDDADSRLLFLSSEKVGKENIHARNYKQVYSGSWLPEETLDRIYERFNVGLRPETYKGHSLSVSDVVVLKRPGMEPTAYYVDSIGFEALPEFTAQLQAAALEQRMQPTLSHDCKEAIEGVIAENYQENLLRTDVILPVVERYGMKRVKYVLANTIAAADWDARYCRENKAWAAQAMDGQRIDPYCRLTSHPVLVDAVAKKVRGMEESMKPQERAGDIQRAYNAVRTRGIEAERELE